MTKQDTIQKLCGIAKTVGEHFGWKHAADCFCKDTECGSLYSFETPILEFIRKAVWEKIAMEKWTKEVDKWYSGENAQKLAGK